MSRRTRLLAVLVLAAGSVLVGAPAQADVYAVVCTGGGLNLHVVNGNATVSGEVTDCVSPLDGDIESATISGSGHVAVGLGGVLVVETTDRIDWNTGDCTTVDETRTVVRLGSTLTLAGTGVTLSGLFYPSTEAEVGTGGGGDLNGNTNGNGNWGSFNGNDNGNYSSNYNGNVNGNGYC
ncbi:hypothetical protein [Lentzea sp. NPDC051838]|uniref:hypothetical protein n=1 Tax=Lentzea sp. NPDC051838 TaxID=3154849 RepID=UPI0034180431